MQKESGEVRIDRKQPGRRLTIDALAHSQHFIGKLELVLLAAYMFDCRIGKCKIERFIPEGDFAARAQHIIVSSWRFSKVDIENGDPFASSYLRPHIMRPAHIQNCLTALIFFDKVLEAAAAEIAPQGHLEVDWVHKEKTF